MEACPLDSNGKSSAMSPATKNMAPAIKIGTEVVKLAYNAIIGAYNTYYGISAFIQNLMQNYLTHHDSKYSVSCGT